MSTQAPPQGDTELVTGFVIGITQKGADKWQVAVQPEGSNYSKNLWTKDAALVGQLSMMIGSHQSFMCGASHWTNQQGQPVRSLWINGVGPQVAQQAQQQPMPQQPQIVAQFPPPPGQTIEQQMQNLAQLQQPTTVVQPTVTQMGPAQQQPMVTPQQKEQRIMREAATKVAGMLISHLPVEQRTMANVIRLSEQLVAYYENGVDWQQSNPSDGDPPHSDDDIPF